MSKSEKSSQQTYISLDQAGGTFSAEELPVPHQWTSISLPLKLEDEVKRWEDRGGIICDRGEDEAEEPVRMLYGKNARDARTPCFRMPYISAIAQR